MLLIEIPALRLLNGTINLTCLFLLLNSVPLSYRHTILFSEISLTI